MSECTAEKEKVAQDASRLKEQLAESSNEVELLKKELSRLSLLLTEKESMMQVAKKQSRDQEQDHLQNLQQRENAILKLQTDLDAKSKIIEDILGAMQAEESSRKCIQKNLEMTTERNQQLESQLKTSHVSLERAVSDATCAKEAYAVMREKADALRSENTSLLEQYDDWAAKVMDDSREDKLKGRFKAAANAVLAKQRIESGNYSQRLASLMQRRQSSKLP